MSARFVTVHSNGQAGAAWIGYVDERDQAYVWVPELRRFAQNDAVTQDLAWYHELIVRPIEPMRARQLCDEGEVGRTNDPTHQWVVDELASAPSIDPASILPARSVPPSRTQQVEALFQQLKKSPREFVIYATYAAEDRAKATRAASDLRNGRVAAFAKALPGVTPEARVLPTEDGRHLVLMVRAKADQTKSKELTPSRTGIFKVNRLGLRPAKKGRLVKAVRSWPSDRPLTNEMVGQRVSLRRYLGGSKLGVRVVLIKKSMVGQTLDEVVRTKRSRKSGRKSAVLSNRQI